MLDINTRFVTLIGTPLAQSFAASMQNAAYRAAGWNMQYFYTEADGTHLAEILDGIRYMPSFAGCAVTKPNKVEVMAHLDAIDPMCARIGSCNTVVRTDDHRLIGYNTDATGFYRAFSEKAGACIRGKSFWCFGAGGVGRAICAALAWHGAKKIYIADVRREEGKALADDICRNFSPVAECAAPGDAEKIAACDAVINASGVGMGKTAGQSPMPKERMDSRQFYFDACYNPARTQFLRDAEEKGGKVLNGLEMSLYQGMAQIELWTGKKAPERVMREELQRLLAG